MTLATFTFSLLTVLLYTTAFADGCYIPAKTDYDRDQIQLTISNKSASPATCTLTPFANGETLFTGAPVVKIEPHQKAKYRIYWLTTDKSNNLTKKHRAGGDVHCVLENDSSKTADLHISGDYYWAYRPWITDEEAVRVNRSTSATGCGDIVTEYLSVEGMVSFPGCDSRIVAYWDIAADIF